MKALPYNTPVDATRGAPMGRPPVGESPEIYTGRLHARLVPLDGGYDRGGAYWGLRLGAKRLWCLFSADKTSFVRFIDATSPEDARAKARDIFPRAALEGSESNLDTMNPDQIRAYMVRLAGLQTRLLTSGDDVLAATITPALRIARRRLALLTTAPQQMAA